MPYGILAADQISTSVTGVSLGAGNATRFKNRIINGNMAIDQRNAGAAINPVVGGYTVDRFDYYQSQTGKLSFQQNAGSVTPPVGFTNYSGFTSLSAYSIAATDQFIFRQAIEGLNMADLGWGTASAKTVTLSFWVRSSLTGTFGGAIQNGAQNRSYPFSFTINSANTWEYETITITGDTTGTWLTTNGIGARVIFSLATGSTYSATAGTWTGSSFITSATGATSVVGTSGATFYITGVQLEVGSSATGFEYVDITTQTTMCQRYYQKSFDLSVAPAQNTGSYNGVVQYVTVLAGANYYAVQVGFSTTMRTAPTATFYSPSAASSNWYNRSLSASSGTSQALLSTTGVNGFALINNPQVSGDGLSQTIAIHYSVTAEL